MIGEDQGSPPDSRLVDSRREAFKMLFDPDESGKKHRQKLGVKKRELTKEKNLQEKRLMVPESKSRFQSLCMSPPLLPPILAEIPALPDQGDDDFLEDEIHVDDDFLEEEMMKYC